MPHTKKKAKKRSATKGRSYNPFVPMAGGRFHHGDESQDGGLKDALIQAHRGAEEAGIPIEEFLRVMSQGTEAKPTAGGEPGQDGIPSATPPTLQPREDPRFRVRVRQPEPVGGGLGRPAPSRGQQLLLQRRGTSSSRFARPTSAPTRVSIRQTAGEKDPIHEMLIRNSMKRRLLGESGASREDMIKGGLKIMDEEIQIHQHRESRSNRWRQEDKDMLDTYLKRVRELEKEEFGVGQDGKPAKKHTGAAAAKIAMDEARLLAPRFFERLEGFEGGPYAFGNQLRESLGPQGEDPRLGLERQRVAMKAKQFSENQAGTQRRFEAGEAAQQGRFESTQKAGQVRREEDLFRENERNLAIARTEIRGRAEEIYKERVNVDSGYTAKEAWEAAKVEFSPILNDLRAPELSVPEDFVSSLRRRVTAKTMPVERAEIRDIVSSLMETGAEVDRLAQERYSSGYAGAVRKHQTNLAGVMSELRAPGMMINPDLAKYGVGIVRELINQSEPVSKLLSLLAVGETKPEVLRKAFADLERVPPETFFGGRTREGVIESKGDRTLFLEIFDRMYELTTEAESSGDTKRYGEYIEMRDRFENWVDEGAFPGQKEKVKARERSGARKSQSKTKVPEDVEREHAAVIKKLPPSASWSVRWLGPGFTEGLMQMNARRRAKEKEESRTIHIRAKKR